MGKTQNQCDRCVYMQKIKTRGHDFYSCLFDWKESENFKLHTGDFGFPLAFKSLKHICPISCASESKGMKLSHTPLREIQCRIQALKFINEKKERI